jgi:membrane protein involved in colicin uptake
VEIQLASRREEAERQQRARLAAAQAATQQLSTEAEHQAATAGQRAAKASAQAEQANSEAEQYAQQLIRDAKEKADQILAQAKAQAEKRFADINSEIEQDRAAAQPALDDLAQRKDSITSYLAQLRQLLGAQLSAASEPQAPPAGPRSGEEENMRAGDSANTARQGNPSRRPG